MADEFETVEIEYSEDDILYYLVDEDGVEVGFVIEEDGAEVECYYEGFDGDEYELVEEAPTAAQPEQPETPGQSEAPEQPEQAEPPEQPEPAERPEQAEPPEPYVPEKAEDHGYLHKIMAIAGHEGGKARDKAEVQLDKVRGKAEVQVDKAKKAATDAAGKAKAKADESDLGITREGVKEATADLNAIAKEGAETAKELKEAYDDIMENFGFLVPKNVRRKLP